MRSGSRQRFVDLVGIGVDIFVDRAMLVILLDFAPSESTDGLGPTEGNARSARAFS